MWIHGRDEPDVLVGSDIVQVNIYGITLNEMLHKGVNLPHLLRRFGFENCVVFDVPRQNSAVADRPRRSLMIDRSEDQDLSGDGLLPPPEVKEELDPDSFGEPGVICSTPLYDDNPLLSCSLSTIRSMEDDGMLESGGGYLDDEEFEEGLDKEYAIAATQVIESSYEDTFVGNSSLGTSPHTSSITGSVKDVMLDLLANVENEPQKQEEALEETFVAQEVQEDAVEEPSPEVSPEEEDEEVPEAIEEVVIEEESDAVEEEEVTQGVSEDFEEVFQDEQVKTEEGEIFEKEEEAMDHPLTAQDPELRAVLGEFFEFPEPLEAETKEEAEDREEFKEEEDCEKTLEAPRNRVFERVRHPLTRSCSLVASAAPLSEEQHLPSTATTSISHCGWLNSADSLLVKGSEDQVSTEGDAETSAVCEERVHVESGEEDTVFPFVSPEDPDPSVSSPMLEAGDFELPGTSVCGDEPPPESPASNPLPFESPSSSSTLRELYGSFDEDEDDEFYDCSRGEVSFQGDSHHDGVDVEFMDAGDGPNVSTKKADEIALGDESDAPLPPPKKKRKRAGGDGIPFKDYYCQFPHCGMKIKWKPGYGRNRLLRHVTGVHYERKPWKCRLCGHMTSSEYYVSGQTGSTMAYHHRSKHPGVPYQKPENCETVDDVKSLLALWHSCFPDVESRPSELVERLHPFKK